MTLTWQAPVPCKTGLMQPLVQEGCAKEVVEDRTEVAVAHLVANVRANSRGRANSWFASREPLLRVDWERRLSPDQDHLKGQVTSQEKVWGVLVTMGIAGMRAQVFKDHDIRGYLLHFACFYDPVMASIMYSTRYNDTDFFHRTLWALFTLGMAGQTAYLNQDIHRFAAFTGFLYGLICGSQFRTAWRIPRARFLAFHDALWNMFAVALFAVVSLTSMFTTPLLMVHVLLRPLSFLSAWWYTRTPELKKKRDVPVNIWYMISRFEGLYMMMIMCSILFPLGLLGTHFLVSAKSATAVILGNFYALLLKFSLLDVTNRSQPDQLEFHAIRYGSRARALFYLLLFPYGVLGMALTGLGLVNVPSGGDEKLSTTLLSFGAFLTWLVVSLKDACHGDSNMPVHLTRVSIQLVASVVFLIPWLLDFSGFVSVVWLVLEMLLLLLVQLAIEKLKQNCTPDGWQWRRPQLSVVVHGGVPPATQDPVQDGKVSSQEHFFTVLFAVAVWKINSIIGTDRNIERYLLSLTVIFFVIWSTIWYAARFQDEDLSHKLIWSLFEFVLLLLLEGLSGEGDRAMTFFNVALTLMLLVLALLFTGRAAFHVPQARAFCTVFMLLRMLCAVFAFASIWMINWRWVLGCVIAGLLFSSDTIAAFIFLKKREWYVWMNKGYLVSRIDGLFMEILGVAVIVPNAVYPGLYKYSYIVAACDVLAVKLAVSIKAAIFGVEPTSYKRHAVNRGILRSLVFMKSVFIGIVALSLFGAGIPLVIKSAGTGGLSSRDPFAQVLVCSASSLFWISQALSKASHGHKLNHKIHYMKAYMQAFGSVISIVPLLFSCVSDFTCLCIITAIAQVAETVNYGAFTN